MSFIDWIGDNPGARVFVVQDFTTGTSTTGIQDVTSTQLGGLTPKAFLTLAMGQNIANDPNETANVSFGMGMTDDAVDDNEFNCFFWIRDNIGTIDTAFGSFATNVSYNLVAPGSSIRKRANGDKITNGVRYDFSTSNTYDARGAFFAFAGTGISTKAGSTNLGTGTSAIDVNTVGFQPDVVIFQSVGSGNGYHYNFGVATADGTQRAVLTCEEDGIADSRPFQCILSNRCGGRQSFANGSLDYDVTASDFDGSGFSLTPSANAGSNVLQWLALKLTGGQVKIVDLTTPTSTGNQSITGVGFKPQAVIAIVTNLEAVDDSASRSTSDLQSGWGISFIANEQWSASYRDDAALATSDCACNFQNYALMGANATNCGAILATLVSFDDDGLTLNYSATQANGKKGILICFQ